MIKAPVACQQGAFIFIGCPPRHYCIGNDGGVAGETVKLYAIIKNVGAEPVGADLCVCPDNYRGGPTTEKTIPEKRVRGEHAAGEHTGSPLPRVIQWFKTMTTNEYIRGVKQHGWALFPGKLWQRNYYEHIIRNENEMTRIREYIMTNSAPMSQNQVSHQ